MTIFRPFHTLFALFFAVIILPQAAPAQAPDAQQDALRREISAAWEAADKIATSGPATVPLRDFASLKVPAGAVFVPAEQANRVMKALGNSELSGRIGLIVPSDGKQQWLIDIVWVGEGYVADAEAKDWEPDTMLAGIREGTEEQNKERLTRGIPAVDIVGWVEKPTYDKATNRLVWSLSARQRGASPGEVMTVNYNTYALGREGYFSLDLITGDDTIENDKPVVRNVLTSLQFNAGKRYADFNSSTDKVAAYGIAALVGAVAVKKLGLLAIVGVFLLKIWKVGLLLALGGLAAIRHFFARLFGGKVAADDWPEAPMAPAADPLPVAPAEAESETPAAP